MNKKVFVFCILVCALAFIIPTAASRCGHSGMETGENDTESAAPPVNNDTMLYSMTLGKNIFSLSKEGDYRTTCTIVNRSEGALAFNSTRWGVEFYDKGMWHPIEYELLPDNLIIAYHDFIDQVLQPNQSVTLPFNLRFRLKYHRFIPGRYRYCYSQADFYKYNLSYKIKTENLYAEFTLLE